MNTKLQGRIGEKLAEEYVLNQAYKILERNFRTKYGEIDLIALDGITLVFIEVKYWKKIGWEEIGYSVDRRKKNKIRTLANHYIGINPEFSEKPTRFDLIFIDKESGIRHLKHAFSECI